jgi:hypothetical protein
MAVTWCDSQLIAKPANPGGSGGTQRTLNRQIS